MPHPDELDELDGEPTRTVADRDDAPKRPWSRILLSIAVGGPALWIGGALPLVVPVFAIALLVLWQRLCTRSAQPLYVPWGVAIGGLAATLTLLQWAPVPGFRTLLGAGITTQVDATLAGTGVEAWPGMSIVPGDTALAAATMLGLSVLFVAAAQLSWRVAAAIVAGTGAAVALIGFAHEAAGVDLIYGVYAARDVNLSGIPALLGTFVNPNHQSSLLLLGLFAAGGLAVDQHVMGLRTRDPSKVDRYGDRFLAAMAALTIQLPALVLSLSRGAMIVLLVLGPLAAWMGLRQQRPQRRSQRKRSRRLSPLRTLVTVGFVGLTLLVAKHGAWRELATLADVATPGSNAETKLRLARESLALLDTAGPIGIGRGAFVDLFGAIDGSPSHILYTHVESMPAAMIVEWGWLGGGAILAGLTAWWLVAFVRARGRRDAVARRIVLLGLLAMATQNAADFSLELLGVSAPAVALAGGLSPPPRWRWNLVRSRWAGTALLLVAIALGFWGIPRSYASRQPHDVAVGTGDEDGIPLLATRPLDGRLHGLIARRAARERDWDTALHGSEIAVDRRPGAVDPWLVRAAAERELSTPERSNASMTEALARLHDPPNDDLVEYLLRHYPEPAMLAAVSPTDSAPWTLVVEALLERAPGHADAIAAKRAYADSEDPAPLRYRFGLALSARNAPLALHHARLWRAADRRKAAAPHRGCAGPPRARPGPTRRGAPRPRRGAGGGRHRVVRRARAHRGRALADAARPGRPRLDGARAHADAGVALPPRVAGGAAAPRAARGAAQGPALARRRSRPLSYSTPHSAGARDE
ncbi:MAG: O-antigen ligase family protein [Myxococcota bacterium]